SLHRAEGFGRGGAEAMSLQRNCLATGWSGNLDYMSPANSLLVNYDLVPVKPGEYPHSEGQIWAEPDLDHARDLALKLIDDPPFARSLAAIARRDCLRTVGNRSVGLRMRAALEAL